jgi:hypothetical protein
MSDQSQEIPSPWRREELLKETPLGEDALKHLSEADRLEYLERWKEQERRKRNSSASPAIPPPARHSIDFRSVHWFGTDYSLTATQAACVKVLWQAWENGTPELAQATILEDRDVESESTRLRDVFRNHSAWGTMIVPGKTGGSFRLNPPN